MFLYKDKHIGRFSISINVPFNIYQLCLGSISKVFATVNTNKTGLHGYKYDFSADYDSIDVDDILDSNKYLMKKHIMR